MYHKRYVLTGCEKWIAPEERGPVTWPQRMSYGKKSLTHLQLGVVDRILREEPSDLCIPPPPSEQSTVFSRCPPTQKHELVLNA